MAFVESEEDKAYITANEAYKRSGSKKSFADWMQEAKDSGIIKEGVGILASLFNKKGTPTNTGGGASPDVGSDKIMGMPKMVFFGVTAIVVIGISIIVYKQIKK